MKMRKRVWGLALASALAAGLLAGCGGEETTADGYAKELYLYNWSEYMSQEVLDQFEAEYGIRVVESTYDSNDEMLAKLLAGNNGEYDIAVPSNFYIESMLANDLILELNQDNIPNLANVDEAYRHMECDPEGKYVVPYMGTAGAWIGNTRLLGELGVEIHTFEDLMNDALKQQIMIVDDAQAIINLGLIGCDLDPTSTDLGEIEQAKNYILQLNPYVKAFAASVDTRDSMARGEVAVTYMYSGEALQAMQQNPDLAIVMDGEQCSLSMDTFVILKGTKHQREAELFLDFLLRPDVSAQLTNEFQFICANKAAIPYLEPELAASPLCVLTDEIKGRLYMLNTFDANAISAETDAVLEIKSAR